MRRYLLFLQHLKLWLIPQLLPRLDTQVTRSSYAFPVKLLWEQKRMETPCDRGSHVCLCPPYNQQWNQQWQITQCSGTTWAKQREKVLIAVVVALWPPVNLFTTRKKQRPKNTNTISKMISLLVLPPPHLIAPLDYSPHASSFQYQCVNTGQAVRDDSKEIILRQLTTLSYPLTMGAPTHSPCYILALCETSNMHWDPADQHRPPAEVVEEPEGPYQREKQAAWYNRTKENCWSTGKWPSWKVHL